MKIAIYSICKNESRNVERFATMSEEADLTVVLDTGSEDDSVARLTKYSFINVYHQTFEPWRFDVARNRCLSLVPDDVDLCLWMDIDEYFVKGWRKTIEDQYDPDTTRYQNHFLNMSSRFEYVHFKVHRRLDCKWIYPIHEQLVFSVPEKIKFLDGLICEHHQDLNKDRAFYISMLEQYLEKNELPRNQYILLLLREYYVNKKYDQCVQFFDSVCDEVNGVLLTRSQRANCYRYYLASLVCLNRPPTNMQIDYYTGLYPSRDHFYAAALMSSKANRSSDALEYLLKAESFCERDYYAEFFHPGARGEVFYKFKAELLSLLEQGAVR